MSMGGWVFLGMALLGAATMHWWFPALMRRIDEIRNYRRDPRNKFRDMYGAPDCISTSLMINRAGMPVLMDLGNNESAPVRKEVWVFKKRGKKVCFSLVPGLGVTNIRYVGQGPLTEIFYWEDV